MGFRDTNKSEAKGSSWERWKDDKTSVVVFFFCSLIFFSFKSEALVSNLFQLDCGFFKFE